MSDNLVYAWSKTHRHYKNNKMGRTRYKLDGAAGTGSGCSRTQKKYIVKSNKNSNKNIYTVWNNKVMANDKVRPPGQALLSYNHRSRLEEADVSVNDFR
jgi:hypothetical protein